MILILWLSLGFQKNIFKYNILYIRNHRILINIHIKFLLIWIKFIILVNNIKFSPEKPFFNEIDNLKIFKDLKYSRLKSSYQDSF